MERALVLRRHFFGADSSEVNIACKALADMCNLLAMSFLQQGKSPCPEANGVHPLRR